MDAIRHALDAAALRRSRAERLLADVRAGLYDDILPASELIAERESAPPAAERPRGMAGLLGLLPDARIEDGPLGRVFFRETWLEPWQPDPIGGFVLPMDGAHRDANALSPAAAFPALSKDFDAESAAAIAPQDIAFFDIETSGMGGSGAVIFLACVAAWDRRGDGAWLLHVQQWMIEDFCHEGELVRRVVDRLSRAKAVCHYNGRSFDMPVLRTRCTMNRMRPRTLPALQLDLLPFSRRLWRGALPDVSLRTVEHLILRHDRGPDVSGAEIPALFFEFARAGTLKRMELVVRHNAQDVATLAALLPRIAATLLNPDPRAIELGSEAEGLARYFECVRDWPRARGCVERAAELCRDEATERALLLRLARLHRRCGDPERALETWRAVAAGRCIVSAERATLEIAKTLGRRRETRDAAIDALESLLARLDLEADLEAMTGRGTAATELAAKKRPAIAKRLEGLRQRGA